MNINETNIHYIRYGNPSGTPLVFLHGWGQNIEMMRPVADPFQKDNDIIVIDLPGYGKSEEPKDAWSVFDYADAIHTLLKNLKIEKPVLLGHSFGGKISLAYASKYDVEKLVLFASPYKQEIKKTSWKLKVLKAAKKVPGLRKLENFAKKHIGSTDYKNASPMMREILVKTVNLDLTEEVKKITCPTLLFWGTLDQAVNIKSAYELEKLIKDAGLIVYEGATHYAYLEHVREVIPVIKTFLR